MKKLFTLFTAIILSTIASFAAFGIMIDGTTPVIGQENPTPMEGFQEFMVLNQSLAAGQTVALYDASTGSTWAVPLDQASVGGITQVDEFSYSMTESGCYDFYIKLKFGEDQLYVGAGTGCGDTPGPGPTPGPTPGETGFGIMIDGTTPVIGLENPTPMEGFQEYMVLNQSLAAGQTVALYDASTGSTWAVPLDQASVGGITQVDEFSYSMTESGCYDFYIKLKFGEDQLYVGAGTGCGDTPGPGPTPGPTPTPGDNVWYIYGYIGGADYNGEDYPFVNGVADISSITADQSTPSYVFVHEYNSGIDYMTNGWAGEVRSVIMYDVATIASGHDKLMLPAGAQNLYLAENADGSVTVSLDPITGDDKPLDGAEPVEYKYFDEHYNLIIVKGGVKSTVLGVIID
ncbi:MAG: hypothetical protein MJ003_07360 [Paludibacteraceae bacterium]|nr:hypothetical protein [Paludibacteraceae bacterium]